MNFYIGKFDEWFYISVWYSNILLIKTYNTKFRTKLSTVVLCIIVGDQLIAINCRAIYWRDTDSTVHSQGRPKGGSLGGCLTPPQRKH
jgi:hypothetical protein